MIPGDKVLSEAEELDVHRVEADKVSFDAIIDAVNKIRANTFRTISSFVVVTSHEVTDSFDTASHKKRSTTPTAFVMQNSEELEDKAVVAMNDTITTSGEIRNPDVVCVVDFGEDKSGDAEETNYEDNDSKPGREA